MAYKAVKTEHAGAKNGGSGYYGRCVDAKIDSKVARRHNDKITINEQLDTMIEIETAQELADAQLAKELFADYLEALNKDDDLWWDLDRDFEYQNRTTKWTDDPDYMFFMNSVFEADNRDFMNMSPVFQEDTQDWI